MAKIKRIFISALLMFPIVSQAIPLPEMPSHPSHPGSAHYEFNFKYALVLVKERKAVLFLPQSAIARKFPVVVFGNGHAVPYLAYKATAEHLAKKGIAVIMPEYQKSVWDKDLQRMASDYNMLTEAAFKKYGDHLDPDRVIYSGHSYGGAVALAASG